jgi:hypothetical protein
VKYYCRGCQTYLKKPSEYTGNLIPNTDTKEIKFHIGFVPVVINGTTTTNMYHLPCVEQYKKEDNYAIPTDTPRVVLVD